jgi:hypothetical protein
MNLIDNKRLFSLTPVVEANPPNRESKYPIVGVSDIGTLGEYITIPGYLTDSVNGYKRRLMFQFNVSFTSDFYLTNAQTLSDFGSMLLLGGCLCIKYRVGGTVYRYKIMDYRSDDNWSNFNLYANQVIKKNFCIEFWQDDYTFNRGITQPFMLQTSAIIIPTYSEQDNSYTDVSSPPYTVDDNFGIALPWALPIDGTILAFNNNI